MKKLMTAALLCLPLLPALAYADCSAQLKGWAQNLQPGRELNTDLAVCKVSPANAAQTLAVLPFRQKDKGDGEDVYDLDVLVADTGSNAIIAHVLQPAAYSSDAFALQSFALDTARYQLTPALRAFGVRAVYAGSSHVDPADSTSLDLYVLDGNTLRPVLTHLETEASNSESDDDCKGGGQKMNRTLGIDANAAAHGYADLTLTEKSATTTNRKTGNACSAVDGPPKVRHLTLHFDGTHYPLSKDMQFDN